MPSSDRLALAQPAVPAAVQGGPPAPFCADRGLAGIVLPAHVHAHAVQYDVLAYDDRLYADFGIPRPTFFDRAVAARRADYLAGRLCAREALRKAGCAPGVPATGAMREPLWPQGMVGSITHTRSYALAVVARQQHCRWLGVDAEEVDPRRASSEAFDLVASAAERQRLLAQWPLPAQAFTVAFGAKEAFFKAASAAVGRYFDFHDVVIAAVAANGSTLDLQVHTPLSDEFPRGHRERIQLFSPAERLQVALLAGPAA